MKIYYGNTVHNTYIIINNKIKIYSIFIMYKKIVFDKKGDHFGNLIALEQGKDFFFDVKRVYYIWGTLRDKIRGKHAHKKLEQIVICVSGSCDFILDDGKKRKIINLNSPTIGLYIKNRVWREFTNFSSDCVLIVLASELYDENDYIRSYNDFRKG